MEHTIRISFPFTERGRHSLINDHEQIMMATKPLLKALEGLKFDQMIDGQLIDVAGAFSYFELDRDNGLMGIRDLFSSAAAVVRKEISEAPHGMVLCTEPWLEIRTNLKAERKDAFCAVMPDYGWHPDPTPVHGPQDTEVSLHVQLVSLYSEEEIEERRREYEGLPAAVSE